MGDSFTHSYNTPRASLIFKVRQAVSHVTDLYSEFSRFIAPAYHHDRCERSVQMKLYSLSKREFFLTFIGFFSVLGVCALLGLSGPAMTLTVEEKASELFPNINETQLASGPFLVKTPTLSPYHHQLWLIAKIILSDSKGQSFKKSFQLSVSIEGVPTDHLNSSPLSEKPLNRTRELRCGGEEEGCAPLPILHLSSLTHTHLIVLMRFHGLQDITAWAHVADVVFYYKTYNPSFTKLQIWVRFIFLLVAFCASCWMGHSLRKYPVSDWSLEQKWISFLLPLLILYNNPLFPLMFLVESWVPSFVDALLQSAFLGALLLFWLCVYHGLRQNERSFRHFLLPKAVLVGWLWAVAVVAAVVQKRQELHHPLYSASSDTRHFYAFKLCFFSAGVVYLVYLVYLVIRAYTELRAMPYFDLRLRFATLLLLSVACVVLAVTAASFGVGVLEDNFVAELATRYSSSVQFMTFYGLVNAYILVMAYVYSPSYRTILECPVLKDNPSLSMVNDSDEEVVYGSDDDTRTPLTAPPRPHEDSD